MLFNSIEFMIFMPIVFVLHWVLPHKYRWILLLGASYYFYMSWNAQYALLIMFITIVSYGSAALIERTNLFLKRLIFITSIVTCLGLLVFFKYFNFLTTSITQLLCAFNINRSPLTLSVLLPVGISFYTFQAIGYVADVYCGGVKVNTI